MFKRMRLVSILVGLGILSMVGYIAPVQADEGPSLFDLELQKVRYDFSFQSIESEGVPTPDAVDELSLADLAGTDVRPPEYKSPGKAFIYSLAVPGAGQLYSGSKLKPLFFLAVEVFAMSQAFKYHGNGDDLTTEFQKYNDDHWNHPDSIYTIGDSTLSAYDAYLWAAYGSTEWDSINDSSGITHRLPDTRDQQYYEMTGKYNQFAWGWDDARLNGNPLDHYLPDAPLMVRAKGDNIPDSPHRLIYEDMRDNANTEYSKSLKYVFVVMGNHLISAFEAFFAAKRHNNRLKYNQPFSNLEVKPSLRSYSSWKDTPYLKLTYRF